MIDALNQDRNRPAANSASGDTRVEPESEGGEVALLARISRAALVGKDARPADLGVPEGGAEAFMRLIGRSRMWSVCELGLRRAGRHVPPGLAQAMREARGRAVISNGRVLGLARMAFPLLAASGIDALAFKGPFQQRQLHGDPFFCRSSDLDLLVPRERFADAIDVLEASGFVRREETSFWWTRALGEVHLAHEEGGVIDLHHRLQQPGCPPPRDLGQFLQSSARERLGEVEIVVPTRAQSLLIAAVNFVKEFVHRRPAGRYGYDVAAGLLRLSEPERREFARLACEQELVGTIGLATVLCEAVFALDLPLPPPLARRGLPDWAEPRANLLAMVFDPDGAATRWPRRRTILWHLCSGPPGTARAAEYARESARMVASEALRRALNNSSH